MSIPLYVRPYVELDFTRMAFDTRVSFSRSSTGTYFDAAGVMQTAASNVPRKEHNPATGAVRGLLVEQQSTNLLTQSGIGTGIAGMGSKSNVSDATVSWFGGAFTAGVAFGNNSVTRLAYITNNFNAIGTVYVLSVFVKMDDGLAPNFGSNAGTYDAALVIGGQSATTVTTTAIGGGIYRISASRSHTAMNSANGVIKYNSNSARSFVVTGYQLEAGTYVTSYIPTTTAAVTRAADVASFTIPPRVVRLVTIYGDGTTNTETVTPGASYTIPTGLKPILRIRGYFA